jgi:hypothetical protein
MVFLQITDHGVFIKGPRVLTRRELGNIATIWDHRSLKHEYEWESRKAHEEAMQLVPLGYTTVDSASCTVTVGKGAESAFELRFSQAETEDRRDLDGASPSKVVKPSSLDDEERRRRTILFSASLQELSSSQPQKNIRNGPVCKKVRGQYISFGVCIRLTSER